jgi:CheY-like chemotaxis protein
MNARERETILLVEDNGDDVLLFRRAARKASLPNPLQVVSDGEEAIAYLGGREPFSDRTRFPLPALVLLDLKLPRKSGHEVLAWLRVQPGLRRLPVAVFTTSRESSDVQRAYDLGANSYLLKPVQFEALIELVRGLKLYWVDLNEGSDLLDQRSRAAEG